MDFAGRLLRGIVLAADGLSATLTFEGIGGETAAVTLPSDQMHPLFMSAATAAGRAEAALGLETVVPVHQVGTGALSAEAGCVVAMFLADGLPLRFLLPWSAATKAAVAILQEAEDQSPPASGIH